MKFSKKYHKYRLQKESRSSTWFYDSTKTLAGIRYSQKTGYDAWCINPSRSKKFKIRKEAERFVSNGLLRYALSLIKFVNTSIKK